MGCYYKVKQGDHLSSIAREFGFSDYHAIWNDGNNSQLRQTRPNPDVLNPDDLVYIPDRRLRQEARPTDARHEFTLCRPKLTLRLVLEDLLEQPIAHASCQLLIDGQMFQVRTDENGKIEQPIQPATRSAELVINDPLTPFNGDRIPIKIGYLDPVEKVSGQVVRLNNLGYYAGDVVVSDPAQFKSAVEEFQCDFGLKVDGICGPRSQAKLKQVHGC